MEENSGKNIFSESDLTIISSVIEFTIERIEARAEVHDAEKQTLATLRELKSRIQNNLDS